jgi:hypothetical protein
MRDITFDISGHGDPYWAVMCNRCNASRGGKTLDEWEAYKARRDERLSLFQREHFPDTLSLPAPGRPNLSGYWEDDAVESCAVHSR